MGFQWVRHDSVTFTELTREYQIVRTHMDKTTWIQDLGSPNHQYHPVQEISSTPKNKTKIQTHHSRQDYHLTQPCPSEGKQANKQNSAQISPSTKLPQTTGSTLVGQKAKGRKNPIFSKERIQLSLKPGKRRLQHNKLKKKIMKRQRNTTQTKEQTRNIEVQKMRRK